MAKLQPSLSLLIGLLMQQGSRVWLITVWRLVSLLRGRVEVGVLDLRNGINHSGLFLKSTVTGEPWTCYDCQAHYGQKDRFKKWYGATQKLLQSYSSAFRKIWPHFARTRDNIIIKNKITNKKIKFICKPQNHNSKMILLGLDKLYRCDILCQ